MTAEVALRKRQGKLFAICASERGRDLVAASLTYRKRISVRKKGRTSYLSEPVACFAEGKTATGEPVLACGAGYLSRVQHGLRQAGVSFSYEDRTKEPRERLQPDWDLLAWCDFRPGQREALQTLADTERGMVVWPTGLGKSFFTMTFCQLMSQARILVTTSHLDPLLDLYRNISSRVPNVGITCSRRREAGGRVQVCSVGCLDRMLEFAPDIVLADEVHEMATESRLEMLTPFIDARMIGMSANFRQRSDQADFELEGLFGEVVAHKTYQEGVDDGSIVPIEVLWRSFGAGAYNPAESFTKDNDRERWGIWRNYERNQMIVGDALSWGDQQVLISVRTLEHALALRKTLPEFEICYSPSAKSADARSDSARRRQRLIQDGLLDPHAPEMTPERREGIKRAFESGHLRKVIATTVWKRGVNFRDLGVLIRADATRSQIDATQITGRLSRTTDNWDKQKGVLIDYLDEFDPAFSSRATARSSHYRQEQWRQVFPDSSEN